jgi:hypothetical protein
MVAHVLWAKGSPSPVICTRVNWERCSQHGQLSTKMEMPTKAKSINLKPTNASETTITLEHYNSQSSK